MVKLPVLSKDTERKLLLQWRTRLEAHLLTGEHFHWRKAERERRRRVDAQLPSKYRSRPGPPEEDDTGIFTSVQLAEERFKDIEAEYRRQWRLSGTRYEGYVGWLDRIKGRVLKEVAAIWIDRAQSHTKWYRDVCGPEIDAKLMALVKEGQGWARAEELKWLQADRPSKRFETRRTVQGDSTAKIGASPRADDRAKQRLRPTITSPIAARRLEEYIQLRGIALTVFASQVGTTDRTLRTFRKTGTVRRDIFDAIANGMGTTREALTKPE